MPLKTSNDELPTLNLTPMIDVVFNLLLFFMVSTQFVEEEAGGQKSFDVKTPEVAAAGTTAPVRTQWVITIHRDGKLAANDQTVTPEQLTQLLAAARKASPKVTVMIRGDGGASFQAVASALSAVRQAGVSELGISVRLAAGANGNLR